MGPKFGKKRKTGKSEHTLDRDLNCVFFGRVTCHFKIQ